MPWLLEVLVGLLGSIAEAVVTLASFALMLTFGIVLVGFAIWRAVEGQYEQALWVLFLAVLDFLMSLLYYRWKQRDVEVEDLWAPPGWVYVAFGFVAGVLIFGLIAVDRPGEAILAGMVAAFAVVAFWLYPAKKSQ